ncbi:hypothetical protein [Sphingobacterium siyangense]|uniref:hypothetical protein n=1 Tax=Sphingobacterium siyangense TaxID=459529 RepID=UPI003DA65535
MEKKLLFFLSLSMACAVPAASGFARPAKWRIPVIQEERVTGTVKDSLGIGLSGVTIAIQSILSYIQIKK